MYNISIRKTNHNVFVTMFDIKPVDDSGNVDVSKIYNIQSVLNLGRKFRIGKTGFLSVKNKISSIKQKKLGSYAKESKASNSDPGAIKFFEPSTQCIEYNARTDPAEDLERYINEDINLVAELTAVGVEFHEKKYSKPTRYRPIFVKHKSEISNETPNFEFQNKESVENYETVLRQINKKVQLTDNKVLVGEPKEVDVFSLGILTLKGSQEMQASNELDMWVKDFSKKTSNLSSKISKFLRVKFLLIIFGLLGLMVFSYYGSGIKNQLTIESSLAVANIENAGKNIKNGDFVSASSNFAQAYQEFSKAGDSMNFLGVSFSSLLSDLPGAGKLKSAKNLIEAGKLMANAGQAMSDAMSEIAKTNLILLPSLDAENVQNVQSSVLNMGTISASLKRALTLSQKNLKNAKTLLADIDVSSIPEDKRASFEEFNSRLPLFEKLIDDFVGYSRFLEDFIGGKGTKRYLILFQNPSELRPTGGFPGTYGVITFKDGKLQDFKVDDVYNLDGQLQELIIPPIQLQHITPNWGMRDANWFIDFPTSARKITTFFKKESGYEVDGVITFNPQIVAKILDIVGPVEMSEYDLILDSNNLFYTLQEEVEYKGDRKQPKQIIVDLAPKMLEKLYSADSDKWLEVFNLLVSSIEQKNILMYFRDLNLESFSVDKGFSGQVKNTDSDYLMVTFTNVKGSKTDLVTDSFLEVQTMTEGRDIKHKVSITRTHNGGDNKYGFYNKQNPAYVRVLVPENAEFSRLVGNSRPNFKPLIDYSNLDFKKDEDLVKFEEGGYFNNETGVTIYKEAGKTEYGFWMIINPGETKTVDLEYTVPLPKLNLPSGRQGQVSKGTDSMEGNVGTGTYQFYIQKQPGLEVDEFSFLLNGKLYYEGRLDKDLMITPH